MHILIVSATTQEIQPLVGFLETAGNIPSPHRVETLVTGVGSIATTYQLTARLSSNAPDILLQAGIAGSFVRDRAAGPVIVVEEILGDMGVSENGGFSNIFDLQLAKPDDAPFTKSMLPNPYKKLISAAGLEQVRAITVNEITTAAKRIALYQQKYAPIVESMEGAAFHYVALQQHIPFLQLRSVSNTIGERDKTKWDIKSAVGALNEKMISIIKDLFNYDETYFRI